MLNFRGVLYCPKMEQVHSLQPEEGDWVLLGISQSALNASWGISIVFNSTETNSVHLKIDAWKTTLSFWDTLFSGVKILVSGRVSPIFQIGMKAYSPNILNSRLNFPTCDKYVGVSKN